MKFQFRVTLDIPAEKVLLSREEMADYMIDAITSWYGGGDPYGETWETFEPAKLTVRWNEEGKALLMENEPYVHPDF